MKVSYEVRFSQSPWPRVMRLDGQLSGRSVDRGKTRLCIELRNQFFARPTLLCQGEGNSDVEREKQRCQERMALPYMWLEFTSNVAGDCFK